MSPPVRSHRWLDHHERQRGCRPTPGAVVLGANTTLASGNGAIDFTSTVNGDGVASRSLTLTAGTGVATFVGAVGGQRGAEFP